MSYRVIRVLLCDCGKCETPSPYVLQGDDDKADKDGWKETVVNGNRLHACPICAAVGQVPTDPASTVVEVS